MTHRSPNGVPERPSNDRWRDDGPHRPRHCSLLDELEDLEHGQIHRDHDGTDYAAYHHYHQRLYDRGQSLYRGVHLRLVELRYLGQHPVYVSRLLPDGDHARHHRREDGLLFERFVERDALADGVPALQESLLHNPVTRGRCGYLYGLQYRHPGRAQGGEGACEAGEGCLLHDVSDLGRYPEHGPPPHLPALLGLLPPQEHDHGERHPSVHKHPPEAGQDVGDKHANPGWQRERPPEVLEHLGEYRHYEDEHERGGQDRKDQNHDRVGQRAPDLASEVLIPLQLVGQAQQDAVEDAPDLPRFNHLDVDAGKGIGVLLESLGEGEAGLHVLAYGDHDVVELGVFGLLREDVERPHYRETSIDHGSQLPGKDHEIGQPDPLERRKNVLLGDALLFYVNDHKALLAELVGHGHLARSF